jgi:hypothetical protein
MGLLFLLSLVTFPTSIVTASVTCGECVWGEGGERGRVRVRGCVRDVCGEKDVYEGGEGESSARGKK